MIWSKHLLKIFSSKEDHFDPKKEAWFVITDFEDEEDAEELAEKEREEVLYDPQSSTYKVVIYNDDPETEKLWGDGEYFSEFGAFESESQAKRKAKVENALVLHDQQSNTYRLLARSK